ncbi:peptidoglycan-binding protein [Candidatus Kaiserbacteria bacterium]|nr:peptidoglycan-binding protein [Candidatus Kaiserbacteria bacterium]MCB9812081.1 peptidoglycan-binding protein [Candidatus Nomurabacteria bacterium]
MHKLLSTIGALALVVSVALPTPAAAQSHTMTNAETQALIASLLEQIEALTTLLAQKQADQAFTHTLTLGSTDATTNGEVTRLQKLLVSEGVYASGIISGYFGNLTGTAVIALKTKYGISPATATFDQSVYDAIQATKQPTTPVSSSDFFEDIVSAYEANYGYQELLVDMNTFDYTPDHELIMSTITETVGDYVVGEGLVGEMYVTDLIENEHGAFGFSSNFDVIGTESKTKDYVYTRLLDFDEEHPFYTEDEIEALEDIQNDWLRTDVSEIETINLISSLETEHLHQLFADGTYQFDFDSKAFDVELSTEFDTEVYSYDVVIDFSALEEFFESIDVLDELEENIEWLTGYRTYHQALQNTSEPSLVFYVADGRMFGLETSYRINFIDEDDDEVVFSRKITWLTVTELATDSVRIAAPREYIKVN